MNFFSLFIHRPVATTLLTIGILLVGMAAFSVLPVSPLPEVDFPTISVSASLPGANPETMAATVATPLERALGRIADVTEMTSSSSQGSTRITLQFGLDRDIDGAARDVQAAINAARTLLPSSLPNNPTYRKVNPADSPVLILALTSDAVPQSVMYDQANTLMVQRLSQVEGVGQVSVGGASPPAVRIEVNPGALNRSGIGLEALRTTIAATNVNRAKGAFEGPTQRWQILANDQASTAKDYMPLIVSYKNGNALKLTDVAQVTDSVENLRNAGYSNGKPSVLVIIFKAPGANVIETVNQVKATLPELEKLMGHDINVKVVMDRTPTIRSSLHDVEMTLLLSIALVIGVVFVFLGNARTTLVPAVAVPVSLVGTFAIMYLLGYTLDNLSLMALTIATGFVVDDAIVVLENITRHMEEGMGAMEAALRGAKEVSFTVMSMSISLIAVFIPILLMGGIVGRLFREFAVTLSAAILVSLIISLTTTPMMCAFLLKRERKNRKQVHLAKFGSRIWQKIHNGYARSLGWALNHSALMLLLMFATIGLNVYLYTIVPKGFFPQQDTGRIMGNIQADQAISFQAMRGKLEDFIRIVGQDPAVQDVVGFTGSGGGGPGGANSGSMFISLKPLSERKISADAIIARLRGNLANETGARLFLQSAQDIRVGGRSANAQYQYTLQDDSLAELRTWAPKVEQAMRGIPMLTDVNNNQQDKGQQTTLTLDRDTMARLGVTPQMVDATLNDAYGQRQISTIYNPLGQHHVVMEADPRYAQNPQALDSTYVVTADGRQIPLAAFSHYEATNTALAVNHQGSFPASTISFNLPEGVSLGDATIEINDMFRSLGAPSSLQGSFQGTAKTFQDSLNSEPILILAALVTIYIVLGVLYESTVHPLTILSTLPSAGVGAVLALLILKTDFTIMALIGVILLIGIVKKNAIILIDFAINAERVHGKSPREAIYEACLLRFRPILMTTMAALLGALPLALGTGDGSELRRPLGIAIVGGLVVSQILTLYTTPVVYLGLDSLRLRMLKRFGRNPHPYVQVSRS